MIKHINWISYNKKVYLTFYIKLFFIIFDLKLSTSTLRYYRFDYTHYIKYIKCEY